MSHLLLGEDDLAIWILPTVPIQGPQRHAESGDASPDSCVQSGLIDAQGKRRLAPVAPGVEEEQPSQYVVHDKLHEKGRGGQRREDRS